MSAFYKCNSFSALSVEKPDVVEDNHIKSICTRTTDNWPIQILRKKQLPGNMSKVDFSFPRITKISIYRSKRMIFYHIHHYVRKILVEFYHCKHYGNCSVSFQDICRDTRFWHCSGISKKRKQYISRVPNRFSKTNGQAFE